MTSMLRPCDPVQLRPLMVRVRRCRYGAKGIKLFNHKYVVPEAPQLVGRTVSVAYDGPDPLSLAVYVEGEWVGTAYDVSRLTEHQRDRFFAARASLRRTILRRALERVDRAGPQPDAARDPLTEPAPDLIDVMADAQRAAARLRDHLGQPRESASAESATDDVDPSLFARPRDSSP